MSSCELLTRPEQAIGERIRRQRRFMCMTQDTLAKSLGVTQASISLWEKGHTTVALRHRRNLSSLLCLDVMTLFAEDLAPR